MEKFNNEIVELIVDAFNDDKQMVIDMLFYLYKTTTDDAMKLSIIDFMNEENTCIECGSEMITYEYKEYHSEVDAYEDMTVNLCPYCDRGEMERLK